MKRRWKYSQALISEYLQYWRKRRQITIKDLDQQLGYTDTAGHWFRRDFRRWGTGGSIPRPADWTKIQTIMHFDDRYDHLVTDTITVLQTVKPHEKGKNPGDMWTITLKQYSGAYFATFPTELVTNALKVGCPPNGVVLDPFAGSGTVGEAALHYSRKAILIDISQEYLELIRQRCHGNIEVIRL